MEISLNIVKKKQPNPTLTTIDTIRWNEIYIYVSLLPVKQFRYRLNNKIITSKHIQMCFSM